MGREAICGNVQARAVIGAALLVLAICLLIPAPGQRSVSDAGAGLFLLAAGIGALMLGY